MRPISFDLDVLRSFVCGVEVGSFAAAAEKLSRSTSAISAQMKKLEAQVGEPLLRKAGRGLALTAEGEKLFDYAQRLLSLNDEAVQALLQTSIQGWVRFGLQEDLSGFLPRVLGQFARAHPKVRIEAQVARNAELLARVDEGALDLAVVWGPRTQPGDELIAALPMAWIGPQGQDAPWRPAEAMPVPLVMFDAPCPFHSMAVNALEREGRQWHVSFTSSSLQGLAAATEAGLGYTVRTRLGLQPGTRLMDGLGLPPLPDIDLTLRYRQGKRSPAVRRLAGIVTRAIELECG